MATRVTRSILDYLTDEEIYAMYDLGIDNQLFFKRIDAGWGIKDARTIVNPGIRGRRSDFIRLKKDEKWLKVCNKAGISYGKYQTCKYSGMSDDEILKAHKNEPNSKRHIWADLTEVCR